MPANDNQPRARATTITHDDGAEPLALIITRRQRARLLALGISEAALHVMTPAEAHRLLRQLDAQPLLD